MDLFLSSPVLGNHVPRTPWLPAPAPLNNFQTQLLLFDVGTNGNCFFNRFVFCAGTVKKKASYHKYVHCMLDWTERVEMCS